LNTTISKKSKLLSPKETTVKKSQSQTNVKKEILNDQKENNDLKTIDVKKEEKDINPED